MEKYRSSHASPLLKRIFFDQHEDIEYSIMMPHKEGRRRSRYVKEEKRQKWGWVEIKGDREEMGKCVSLVERYNKLFLA